MKLDYLNEGYKLSSNPKIAPWFDDIKHGGFWGLDQHSFSMGFTDGDTAWYTTQGGEHAVIHSAMTGQPPKDGVYTELYDQGLLRFNWFVSQRFLTMSGTNRELMLRIIQQGRRTFDTIAVDIGEKAPLRVEVSAQADTNDYVEMRQLMQAIRNGIDS